MTQTQKKEFVRELFHSVRSDIDMKLPRVPEEWDGHELRVWIAEYFERAARMSCIAGDKRGSRRKAYDNAVIVDNL